MRPTRGQGRLEGFIARSRMAKVLRAIKPSLRGGEILDIGCGNYPLFLLSAPFTLKVGVDQLPPAWIAAGTPAPSGVEIVQHTLTGNIQLPFPDDSFGCVTSLACIEHLDPECLPSLVREMLRVLKPGGQAILTTPHASANAPLLLMARLGLVSREEIDEHKSLFLRSHVFDLLEQAGFAPESIKVRGFQMGMNIIAVAEK